MNKEPMKLEEQVVSRALSQELEKNGYPQQGLWYYNKWSKKPLPSYAENAFDKYDNEFLAVAPTVAELGRALPDYYNTFRSAQFKLWCCFSGDDAFDEEHSIDFLADTEANARAKMWLHLKKEDLL